MTLIKIINIYYVLSEQRNCEVDHYRSLNTLFGLWIKAADMIQVVDIQEVLLFKSFFWYRVIMMYRKRKK